MKVLGRRVLLKPVREVSTASGLVLPESVKTNRFEVVAIGGDCENVEVGQIAIVHQGGIPFLLKSEQHFIYDERTLELIFDKDEQL